MLTIDGSYGEGGGQILRSSLGLAMLTQTAFRITHIRAKRKRPGLMRQHLTAVTAAATLSQADVEGAEVGSTELTFRPGPVRAGEHSFSVGTAGSATLVLQAVLPGLLHTSGRSVLTLEGGTHNPMAPPFDALAKAFLPLLNRMGCSVEATLEQPGFYPAGGGRFRVTIEGGAKWKPLELLERGELRTKRVRAVVAGLSRSIAERELQAAKAKLGWEAECFRHEAVRGAQGPGNVVCVELVSEHVTEIFTGFGEKGVTAEEVASGVAQEALEYIGSGVPVGKHLADQLLLPMAMAGGGVFRTHAPTEHTRTQVQVLKYFGLPEVRLVAEANDVWRAEIGS